MPVPRPPIHLVASPLGVRAVDRATGLVDVTDRLTAWANDTAPQIATLDGAILKSRSPSCGVADTPLVGTDRLRAGLFAAWLTERFPDLPLIDEAQWEDEPLRDAWWRRVGGD